MSWRRPLANAAVVLALGASAATDTAAQSVAVIHGVVRDSSTRQPINGAIVEIAGTTKRYATRTDEAGEFDLADVEAGSYRLLVRRIGYAPGTRDIAVSNGMRPLDIRLAPVPQSLREVRVRGEGSGIFGQIATSDDLRPISGARVFVAGTRDSTVTDSAGSYFMPVKGGGVYMVRVQAPGFAEDMFVVDVKKNAVADGSRLLDAGDSNPMPPILWQDFDQRIRWRSTNGGVLLSGSDLRRSGSDLLGAFRQSGAMIARNLRVGAGLCVFLDGQPFPAYPLQGIRLDDVRAVEVYAVGTDSWRILMEDWPKLGKCSATGEPITRNSKMGGAIVIWTR